MARVILGLGIWILCPCLLWADDPETFVGRALSVSDGDTIRLRRNNSSQVHRIRLFGLDAPESDQPAGDSAKKALWNLVKDQDLVVKTTGEVTYGRLVARVYVGGDVYVNQELMEDGWGWHYDSYTKGQPEAAIFSQAEAQAKKEGVGLWAGTNPIRPSCWRRGDRDGDCKPDGPDKILAKAPAKDHIPFALPKGLAPLPDGVEPPVDGFLNLKARRVAARDSADTSGHVVFGRPKAADGRFRFRPNGSAAEVEGITELQRTAFTVGHFDKYRLPAWVAMRWTKTDFDKGVGVSLGRPSASVDDDLPEYAQGGTSFEFSKTKLERGHMARDEDMESWGAKAVAEAVRMSNFVPQRQGKNHAVWGVLENLHRDIVANDDDDFEIDRVWLIAGPVFYPGRTIERVGKPGTAVPHATYKVIAWFGRDGRFLVRGYVIDQDATNADVRMHLRSVRYIEQLTGLNFFPDLQSEVQNAVEEFHPDTLWDD